jgi:hypothetical protein
VSRQQILELHIEQIVDVIEMNLDITNDRQLTDTRGDSFQQITEICEEVSQRDTMNMEGLLKIRRGLR